MSRNRLVSLASEFLPERISWCPQSELRPHCVTPRTNFGFGDTRRDLWFECGFDLEVVSIWQFTKPTPSRAVPNFERPDRRRRLFLEEPVGGDGDGHFPRLWVNEIRQRENNAIDDFADHCGQRENAAK